MGYGTAGTIGTTDLTSGPASASRSSAFKLDGPTLRRLLESGAAWLARNATPLNDLNVFPVPDGDTGTNMVLTMRSGVEGLANMPDGAAQIARAAAQGAVMGARGNSGVILSQILAGMARGLEARCDAEGLAAALVEGAETAYRAVPRPVEGTILTVARAAGEAAQAAVREAGDAGCEQVLAEAHAGAQRAVERTPEQLPLLRQAGVVDAGGEGYRVLLEGMLYALRGIPLPEQGSVIAGARPATNLIPQAPQEEWGYCTQFVIRGERLDISALRDELLALAESALVVGDETLVRVHAHTEDPGQLLSYGARYGRLQRIAIEDMDAQHAAWLRSQAVSVTEGGDEPPGGDGDGYRGNHEGDREDAPITRELATVAVAPGAGLAEVFRSYGAGEIVAGGQTMNPSAHDLLNAARRTGARAVIVLPNNGNVVMTAQQAAALAEREGRRLIVVPTRTVVQGIAAQLAYSPEGPPEAAAATMMASAQGVRTVEITRATRTVTLENMAVREGDVLGLLDDRPVAAGGNLEEVARAALEQAGAAQAEVITVYHGQNTSHAQAARFVEQLRGCHPSAEIEVVDGGQPHYDYIISVE